MSGRERDTRDRASEATGPSATPSAARSAATSLTEQEVRAVMSALPRPLRSGELTYRLTLLIFPAILLVFVALYVTSLASGAEPETVLVQAGGASLVLAVLGRVALGIVGNEDPLAPSEREIAALARAGALKEQILAIKRADGDVDADHTPHSGSVAGDGGKE